MKYLTILLAIVSITRLALAQEVDTLASVSADYTAKRTAGLKRLSDTAKGELEAVKRAQMGDRKSGRRQCDAKGHRISARPCSKSGGDT